MSPRQPSAGPAGPWSVILLFRLLLCPQGMKSSLKIMSGAAWQGRCHTLRMPDLEMEHVRPITYLFSC